MAYSLRALSSTPPTRLRLPDLLYETDRYADGVLEGRFDHLLPDGALPVDSRWYTRLHADDELDVWLISWTSGRGGGVGYCG